MCAAVASPRDEMATPGEKQLYNEGVYPFQICVSFKGTVHLLSKTDFPSPCSSPHSFECFSKF